MPQQQSPQERVERLEELFSHHQHLVQQLNEVIVQLRAEVENLKARAARYEGRLQQVADKQASLDDQPDEKPPHY
jgi:uncharacterized coiled-coil protein SlyX